MKYNFKIIRKPINEIDIYDKTILDDYKDITFIDLRNKFTNIFDQEDLDSSTANALCALIQYKYNFIGSRLFLYYNQQIDKTDNDLADGINSLIKYGICSKTEWKYDITKCNIKPPEECYKNALYKSIQFKQIINDITCIKNTLAAGYPIIVALNLFESFKYNKSSGYVHIPNSYEKCLGSHTFIICGYYDIKKVFIVRNSQGVEYGDNGYVYLPYLYLLDSALSSYLYIMI